MAEETHEAGAAPRRRRTKREREAARALAARTGKCTSIAKSSGKPCRLDAVPGRPTCKRHGGNGGRPIESGRYTELAGLIGAAYRASLADASLLDPREPLAGLDALVKVQIARLEAKDSPRFRAEALALLLEFQECTRVGEQEAAGDAFLRLSNHLREGAAATEAEAELSRRLQTFARHNEEANRLRLAKTAAINAQALVKLFAAVLGDVRARCTADVAEQVATILQARIDGGDPTGPLAVEMQVARGAGADVGLGARRN